MSIQSEINRISGNVADALAAIAEKGVTVPNGSNSDALAGLIAAIQAGGGGNGSGYFENDNFIFACGSIILATATKPLVIDCGFPIGITDKFSYCFTSMPIATRTSGTNLGGFAAFNCTTGAMTSKYGVTGHANTVVTTLSTTINIKNANQVVNGSTEIKVIGWSDWNFDTSLEYFWLVVKEK